MLTAIELILIARMEIHTDQTGLQLASSPLTGSEKYPNSAGGPAPRLRLTCTRNEQTRVYSFLRSRAHSGAGPGVGLGRFAQPRPGDYNSPSSRSLTLCSTGQYNQCVRKRDMREPRNPSAEDPESPESNKLDLPSWTCRHRLSPAGGLYAPAPAPRHLPPCLRHSRSRAGRPH